MLEAQIVVLAKEPWPGRVKTRLIPALSGMQAAGIAEAALLDTLDAVRATDVAARVLVLDGSPAALPTTGFSVHPQIEGGLDERIAAAFATAYDARPLPILLVGMDTPQVTPELLSSAVSLLLSPAADAVLGLAEDGGWWAMGLRRPDDTLLHGVPMSSAETGRCQSERLSAAGLRWHALPVLRDIDEVEDLQAVALLAPGGRVARRTAEILTGSGR